MADSADVAHDVHSLLSSSDRDFLLRNNVDQVPISELEGKIFGLYFWAATYKSCRDFTPQLKKVYEKMKAKWGNFEVVLIPLDDDEESFNQEFENVSWLSLPIKDQTCEKLTRYFALSVLPTLVIIGADGRTLHPNVAEAIEGHGIDAYDLFTFEHFSEIDEITKDKEEYQTLESILVSGDQDFIIGKDSAKVSVSELTGKTVLLYFSAHWSPPCRAFLPKLIDAYYEIKDKDKDNAIEVVFISSDRDQTSFDEFYAGMPWLALPFGDSRKSILCHKFKVSSIPMLVAIGPSGRTVTKEARDLIETFGAYGYPFTNEKIKQIEKVKDERHEHELVWMRPNYSCDGCDEDGDYFCDACDEAGYIWSYHCKECNYDLHPECAWKNKGNKDNVKEEEKDKDGLVCEGEVSQQ